MALIKKKPRKSEIPTASLADIAFLILIFFLVSTTIDMDKGLGLVLPAKGQEIKVRSENICNLLIDAQGNILLDKKEIDIKDIKPKVESMLAKNPKLIISVKSHPRTDYQVYISVIDQLKQAKATRISIAE
ncbi:MAG: biopolymer transporter ExbD [Candidatus Marinimicrobia bacterium]|nr:biopolymer transporter ExbD [Candidatus Neomarinimicrobiota bacterium]